MAAPNVQLAENGGIFTVTSPHYQIKTALDRPFVTLVSASGERLAELFVASSVHSTHGQDDTTGLGAWRAVAHEDTVTLTLTARSSVWQEKVFRFVCRPDRLSYDITVVGEGRLADVHYFGGYSSAILRWGSGFFPSGQHFTRGFTPAPNTDELPHFAPAESSVIDITGVPLPGRGDWFFTPPPFCFAFEHTGGWVGMGVEASAGEHQFTEYRYNGQRGAFYLTLGYEGQTAVSGSYTLPALGMNFVQDAYDAVSAHCLLTQEKGDVQTLPSHPRAGWWYQPIFCGWGAQCHLAAVAGGRAPAFARQEHYNRFLESLAAQKLSPGIVVLDDKWQATYGNNEVDTEKWPDLPGFVRGQHEQGRHVLLWLKLWDPEGVPAEECVRNAAGLPVAVDPTNPRFEERLRASVRQMLGPDGYNADGFKIDFSARLPSGPGMQRHGREWGLELMKRLLGILYDEAKRIKPDALVMTHTPHPYLADVLDMVRLNDVNIGTDITSAMRHRAKIASIACPAALIDTDNWPITDRASWRAYMAIQETLGVPSLYYVDHIDTTGEPLQPEDYELIRSVWDRYHSSIRSTISPPTTSATLEG